MAKRQIKFDFDPLAGVGKKITPSEEKRIVSRVKDYVLESVLSKVGEGISPVSGQGSFKRLNKEYAINQKGGNRLPNLELMGDMLDSLKIIKIGDKLRLTVDESQQDKADGHNNFSGKSALPRRAFIPDEKKGETFKKDILEGIRTIIEDELG